MRAAAARPAARVRDGRTGAAAGERHGGRHRADAPPGGRRDARRALQVTAYSFTPTWVAATLVVVPALGAIAAFIGLYGLYLFYLGLPALMRAPADKSLGYTVVVVICTIVLTIAVALATGILITLLAPGETGTVQV